MNFLFFLRTCGSKHMCNYGFVQIYWTGVENNVVKTSIETKSFVNEKENYPFRN